MKRFALVLSLPALAALSCAHAQVPPQRAFDQIPSVDVPGLNTRLTPEQVTAQCQQAEKKSDAALAALVAVPDNQRTFANSFNAFEQTTAEYVDAAGRLSFLKDIHPDAGVRKAAAACEEEMGKYLVKVGARKDIYLALKSYLDHQGKSDKHDAVDERLIYLTMRDFKRNGLALPDAQREKLVKMRQRIAELETEYSANLDNDDTHFETTEDQLAGMPPAFIEAHLKDKNATAPKGKRIVVLTTQYPDYYPIMENAKSEALRKQMWFAFQSREAAKNLPLITEAVTLRDESAKMLGYPSHADYVTDVRMAKNAKTVAEFLDRLRADLVPARDRLNKEMLAMKIADTHDPKAVLETWDWRYYINQIKKQRFSIDGEAVRQYFPADKVMAGMFKIYSTLFNVKYTEVPGAPVWAKGVKLYEVHDGLDGQGKLLAKFYVDLFPREGKYGHAASFNFGIARDVPGGYQIPISALVVNFNPPRNGQSARLSFEEVDTLFHEFGHIMHDSLTTARYASESGLNVSVDFVEAPSQMLENWVYQPQILAMISEDPKNPGYPMPTALAQRIAAARTFDAGVRYTRQIFFATFDQAIHTEGAHVDVDAVEHKLRGEITAYPPQPGEHTAASFGHLMGGYDAGYYGYLWSEVYADDMFSRFEKDGLLNSKTGMKYREDVLARGQEVEPMDLLEHFLGRKPNEDAFLRITGIKAE